mgnify:CR=1 FL=1
MNLTVISFNTQYYFSVLERLFPRLSINASTPPFSYFLPQTYKAMEFVKNLRDKDSEKCYFTMDAGPNVKVLCLEEDLERLAGIFSKKYEIIVSRTVEL